MWRWSMGTSTSTTRAPDRRASMVSATSRPKRSADGSPTRSSRRTARWPDRGSTTSRPVARRIAQRARALTRPAPPRPSAGGKIADGHVGLAGQHRVEQEVGGRGGGGQVGVDQDVDVGVGGGVDAGQHGPALAPVGRQAQDLGPGGAGRGRRLVAGPVVDHEDAVDGVEPPQRRHRRADVLGPILGRHQGDDDRAGRHRIGHGEVTVGAIRSGRRDARRVPGRRPRPSGLGYEGATWAPGSPSTRAEDPAWATRRNASEALRRGVRPRRGGTGR